MIGHWMKRAACAAIVLVFCATSSYATDNPLPSWHDGPAKQAIVDFVAAATTQGGEDFVSPADRIATFDQDGTTWVSHPIYGQALFALAEKEL